MSKSIDKIFDEGGPAFPQEFIGTREVFAAGPFCGLTKRELFAAMAMQGILANPDPQYARLVFSDSASWAVISADALLRELGKQ